jgi:membrane protein implicated in regulation of membrane protease activity
MSALWLWWVMAAILIGAELLTGTYYLLAVGAAFALGGVAAWLGASIEVQLAVAAVLSVALTMAAHQWRLRRGVPPPQPGLDVGQSVRVEKWNADGTARVAYRGSQWNAELATPDTTRAETMYVVDTRGSTLVIADRRPV